MLAYPGLSTLPLLSERCHRRHSFSVRFQWCLMKISASCLGQAQKTPFSEIHQTVFSKDTKTIYPENDTGNTKIHGVTGYRPALSAIFAPSLPRRLLHQRPFSNSSLKLRPPKQPARKQFTGCILGFAQKISKMHIDNLQLWYFFRPSGC